MINGFCFTNLDGYRRVEWPTEFVALPRVGDKVEGAQGERLRVVAVTHACVAGRALVRIELHK